MFDNNEMLDAYLFEANELLEGLDDLLIDCEKNNNFDEESINTIFRTMHTLKGSSAMMEFDSLATVSHKIEDLFSYVRENGFDCSHNSNMFELLFKASDFLKSELEKVREKAPLTTNIGYLTDEINNFLKKISSGENSDDSDSSAKSDSAESASAAQPAAESTAAASGGTQGVKFMFDEEAKMENLRAYMLLNEVTKVCPDVKCTPENPQDAKAEDIAKDGFVICFNSAEDYEKAKPVIDKLEFVKSSTVLENRAPKSDGAAMNVKFMFDEDAKMENLRAFMLLNEVTKVCPDVKCTPENPQDAKAEDIAKNGFVICFNSAEDYEKAKPVIDKLEFVKSSSAAESEAPAKTEKKAEAPQGQPTPKPAANNKPAAHSAAPASSIISVNLAKLDNLIDLMGEIVITESMVTSIPRKEGFNFDNFMKAVRQLQKLTGELQENIMSIRMIPISNVFNKMNRIVRDMSKKLSKDVELVISGESTEVDKTVIDNIGDPIMHIVRNSMDHGIESAEQRAAAGKPAKGTITLKAENTAGEILVTISDDGKGFDEEAILRKAKEKGLLKKPESEYTKKEIYSLVLMPGFSTKENVTEFSGRGVGLDVVKNNIEKIGGTVALTSQKGHGTTITITIPLTLAIIDGMDIAVGKSIFTVPIHSIRQSFKPTKDNLLTDSNGAELVMIRNKCYPIIRLHEKLGIETECTDICDGILLLVEAYDTAYCIFVDSLIGEQQIVIKPLPQYLNNFELKEKGISGCAILGDGSISLILDVVSLYNN